MKIIKITDNKNDSGTKELADNVNFIRPDGTNTEHAVGYIINSTTEEIMFFEILGMSTLGGIPTVKIRGEEKYKRLMIRRCYPVIDSQELSEEKIISLIR